MFVGATIDTESKLEIESEPEPVPYPVPEPEVPEIFVSSNGFKTSSSGNDFPSSL